MASGKIQKQDVKTVADLTDNGATKADLIQDTQIYMSEVAGYTLAEAKAAGLLGGPNFGPEPGAVSSSTSGQAGVATTMSRADHNHDLGTHAHSGATDGGTISHTALTDKGTNTHSTIDDHLSATSAHGMTGLASAEPGVVNSSSSGAAGSSTKMAREDHNHDLGVHRHTSSTDGGAIPLVPFGCVLASFPHLTGAYNCTNTTADTDGSGYVVCGGQTIDDPTSPMHGAVIPNINNDVFLAGNTTSGTAGGANTKDLSHTHSFTGNAVASGNQSVNTTTRTTSVAANMPAHYHGIGTGATLSFSGAASGGQSVDHTHTITTGNQSVDHTHTYSGTVAAETTEHTHSWGGWWSNDNASSVTSGNGDGTQNTYSDGIIGINAWGTGGGGAMYASRASDSISADHTHTINHAHGDTGSATVSANRDGGSGTLWTHGNTGIPAYANAGYIAPATIAGSSHGHTTPGYTGSSSGASTNHTHIYWLPSHRHYIKARNTGGRSASHTHTFSGTSSGISVSHTHSGTTAGANVGHTHQCNGSVSGTIGLVTEGVDGNVAQALYFTQPVFTVDNHTHTTTSTGSNSSSLSSSFDIRPSYITTRYIMRIK